MILKLSGLILNDKGEAIHDPDPLNLGGRRNSANTVKSAYNCGGWALKTFNWYYPYDCATDEREDFIANKFQTEEYDDAIRAIVDNDAAFISRELGIRRINLSEIMTMVESGREIILYRFGPPTEDDVKVGYYDYDFHFLRITGFEGDRLRATEKLGDGAIQETETTTERLLCHPWKRGAWSYDSPIAAFVL